MPPDHLHLRPDINEGEAGPVQACTLKKKARNQDKSTHRYVKRDIHNHTTTHVTREADGEHVIQSRSPHSIITSTRTKIDSGMVEGG